MAITNAFRDAVESGKKTRVKIMLKDIMLVDPTMEQFDEMLEFAKLNIPDLFDEHNEEILKYDSNDWNEDYLNRQMVVVVGNFSKERIELLRNMVKCIYHDKAEKIRANKQSALNVTKKQVGTGMAAAGAVAVAVGIGVHQGLLIAGGVAVAAIGVGLIVIDREE